MKRLQKAVCLVTACVLAVTMFAGCGKKQEAANDNQTQSTATGNQTQSTGAEDPLKDKMNISIAYWGISGAIKPDVQDKVRDIIYNKLNIEITPVNVTWDDYTQKIQVWAAASQLPDAFAIDALGTTNYTKWTTQGIVRALPENLDQYPNVKKILEDPGAAAYKTPMGSPDAKFYAIPRPTYPTADMWANDVAVLYRKDWMQNVGITKEPETMDEFITMMKAFANNDPDGNGKKDTMGLTMYNAGWLQFLMMGYEPGITVGSGWIRDTQTGKWTQAFMTDGFLEGVLAMKKLYDEGGMDLDFATLKGEEGFDKFASSRAGAYAHSGYPATHNTLLSKFKKSNPNIDWANEWDTRIAQLKPFKCKDGNYYRQIQPTPWSETYINANVDDKKADRIMRLFDFLISDEGFNLMRLGIEGVDYTKEGDKITITKQKDDKGNYINNYPICGLASMSTWAQDFQYKDPITPPKVLKVSGDMLNWEMQNCKPVNTDIRVGYIDFASKDKMTFNWVDALTKAILSKDAEKSWKASIAEKKADYDIVIKDFNDAAEKLGIK